MASSNCSRDSDLSDLNFYNTNLLQLQLPYSNIADLIMTCDDISRVKRDRSLYRGSFEDGYGRRQGSHKCIQTERDLGSS
jgi:hypothetical protein